MAESDPAPVSAIEFVDLLKSVLPQNETIIGKGYLVRYRGSPALAIVVLMRSGVGPVGVQVRLHAVAYPGDGGAPELTATAQVLSILAGGSTTIESRSGDDGGEITLTLFPGSAAINFAEAREAAAFAATIKTYRPAPVAAARLTPRLVGMPAQPPPPPQPPRLVTAQATAATPDSMTPCQPADASSVRTPESMPRRRSSAGSGFFGGLFRRAAPAAAPTPSTLPLPSPAQAMAAAATVAKAVTSETASATTATAKAGGISGVLAGSLSHDGHVGLSADGSFDLDSLPKAWRAALKSMGLKKADIKRDPALRAAIAAAAKSQAAPPPTSERQTKPSPAARALTAPTSAPVPIPASARTPAPLPAAKTTPVSLPSLTSAPAALAPATADNASRRPVAKPVPLQPAVPKPMQLRPAVASCAHAESSLATTPPGSHQQGDVTVKLTMLTPIPALDAGNRVVAGCAPSSVEMRRPLAPPPPTSGRRLATRSGDLDPAPLQEPATAPRPAVVATTLRPPAAKLATEKAPSQKILQQPAAPSALLAGIRGFDKSSLVSGRAVASASAIDVSLGVVPPPPQDSLMDRLRAVVAAKRTTHASSDTVSEAAADEEDDGWGSD